MKFKMIRKCFLTVSAVTLMMLQPMSVFAAEPYTYTVTISAGNKGEIQNAGVELVSKKASKSIQGNKIVIKDLSYNDRINVSYADAVRVTDKKYYAQVLRESGKDNKNTNVSSITVTADMDYVIGYGVKGNQVAYTVNYVDENGTELGKSNTYYGNVGDRPVVAYRYFEGYLPRAYNLTKTLVSNAAENVFTFTYRKMTPEEIIRYADNPQAPTATRATAPDGATTAQPADDTANPPADGAANAPAGDTGGDLTDVPDEETPQGLVDLDDEDVPQSNVDLGKDDENGAVRNNKNKMPLYIAIGALAVAGIVAVVLVMMKRKKKNKKIQTDEEE